MNGSAIERDRLAVPGGERSGKSRQEALVERVRESERRPNHEEADDQTGAELAEMLAWRTLS